MGPARHRPPVPPVLVRLRSALMIQAKSSGFVAFLISSASCRSAQQSYPHRLHLPKNGRYALVLCGTALLQELRERRAGDPPPI